MNPVELQAGKPLHELLSLHHSGGGVDEVKRLATLSVGGLDGDATQVLGRKVAEWASADLVAELEKAFDADPFALLARGWAQLRKLRKAVDASRGPPPKPQTASLLKHDLEGRLAPRLVLNVNGIDWCELQFNLSLKLTVDAAELTFNEGRLTNLRWVKPVGSITLQCQGQELAAFKRELKFAAAYAFNPPLAWPKLPAASALAAGSAAVS
jgi:hypothetical protein